MLKLGMLKLGMKPLLSLSKNTRRLSLARVLLLGLLCGGAILALPPAPMLSGQETLSIRGKVVNGTEGFAAPHRGMAVLMLITGPEGTLSGTGQTQTAPDGSFAFDDAPLLAGGAYTLSADYRGVFYRSSFLNLPGAPDDLAQEVIITIYEPTEDAGIITVERQVMVITNVDVAQRLATATEFVRFVNPTDRTLRPNLAPSPSPPPPEGRPTLSPPPPEGRRGQAPSPPPQGEGQGGGAMFSFMRFALPPEASDITVQSNLRGGEVISVGSGFALTAAVPPGEHSVDFTYTFPYDGGSLDYRNSLPQGAGIFQILVPERWPGIEIGGLNPRPPVAIQDQVYRAWERRDIPPGPGVQILLEGLPQPGVWAQAGETLSGGSFWTSAIPAATGAALLALLALGLARPVPSPSRGAG